MALTQGQHFKLQRGARAHPTSQRQEKQDDAGLIGRERI
jgi:hypothetical protein